MQERLIWLARKASVPATVPWVRIPPPPPQEQAGDIKVLCLAVQVPCESSPRTPSGPEGSSGKRNLDCAAGSLGRGTPERTTMTYEVLALKYRPKVFEDLVGQETVTRTLTHAIQQNRIAHAFLFAGVRGVGKTTTARILAKALNCASGPTVRPCGECAACLEIAQRKLARRPRDRRRQQQRGRRSARHHRGLALRALERPLQDLHHRRSAHALDARLQRAPQDARGAAAERQVHFRHHRVPQDPRHHPLPLPGVRVPHRLSVRRSRSSSGASSTPRGSGPPRARSPSWRGPRKGSLRDGISALDQVIAATGTDIGENEVTEILGLVERQVLRETAEAIVARDTEAILRVVDRLSRSGRDLRFFTSSLMQYLRDVLVTRVAPQASDLLDGSRRDRRFSRRSPASSARRIS